MPDAPNVVLRIDDVGDIPDIISCSISMGMEQVAHEFHLELSEKWLARKDDNIPFQEGDRVKVLVDGELLVDGFINNLPISYDAHGHSVGVSGRSWTGHLCDSSAIVDGRTWRDVTLDRVAADICNPFGISVKVDADLGQPFRRYGLSIEESAISAIQRGAAQRGVHVITETGAELVFTGGSDKVHPMVIRQGINVKSGTREGRWSERHDRYLAKGQAAGTASWSGALAAHVAAESKDEGVPYHRPLVVYVDGSPSEDELQKRADWERNVRAGRSRRLIYELQGWRADGKLWRPNLRANVVDPLFDVDAELLIVHVTYSFDGQEGSKVQLQLMAPEAFQTIAPPPRHRRQARGHDGRWVKTWQG